MLIRLCQSKEDKASFLDLYKSLFFENDYIHTLLYKYKKGQHKFDLGGCKMCHVVGVSHVSEGLVSHSRASAHVTDTVTPAELKQKGVILYI